MTNIKKRFLVTDNIRGRHTEYWIEPGEHVLRPHEMQQAMQADAIGEKRKRMVRAKQPPLNKSDE